MLAFGFIVHCITKSWGWCDYSDPDLSPELLVSAPPSLAVCRYGTQVTAASIQRSSEG
jgi:hypothetical protein